MYCRILAEGHGKVLETRERPVEGHVEGEEGGGREGARGRGQRTTDECAVRIKGLWSVRIRLSLFKVCVDTGE